MKLRNPITVAPRWMTTFYYAGADPLKWIVVAHIWAAQILCWAGLLGFWVLCLPVAFVTWVVSCCHRDIKAKRQQRKAIGPAIQGEVVAAQHRYPQALPAQPLHMLPPGPPLASTAPAPYPQPYALPVPRPIAQPAGPMPVGEPELVAGEDGALYETTTFANGTVMVVPVMRGFT